MKRTYDEALVNEIIKKQYVNKVHGMDVLIKPIPDCDEEGMMDPRVYQDNKKMAMMMRFLPKSLLKMDTSPKGIEKLREMFNKVKSIPVTSEKIEVLDKIIKGKDDNDLTIKIYLPIERKESMPVLYYMHGGGFFGGHMGVIDQLNRMIVEKFSIVAVSIDYRLAPENPYPKGHEDCFEGLKWVYQHICEYGGDANHIFVAGDSAGGNLAQYCTTRDMEDQSHMIKGQMLLYPTVNMGGIQDEYSTWNINRYQIHPKHKKTIGLMLDMMGGEDGMTSMMMDILGTKNVMIPYLTPYMMDLKDMPPTLMSVGEHDFLYVECLAYAKKLVDANVDTTTIVYRGMGHAYGDNIGVYPQSESCAIDMGNFMMKYSGGTTI